jgi:putative ABC transport system permease protein
MMMLRLAIRNTLGAGLRTWLNVVALSFSFVAIIGLQGFYDGMNEQVQRATVDALYGGGQYWQQSYDPYDPLSFDDAHGALPPTLDSLVQARRAAGLLFRSATIYPHGRFQPVLLKGIDPAQTTLSIPSGLLRDTSDGIPALIGVRMAKNIGAAKEDMITVQWRDVHGTYDARDMRIVGIFRSTVQEIDNGQIWMPLERLQEFTGLRGQATMVVLDRTAAPVRKADGWVFKDLGFLLRDLRSLIKMKEVQGSILYLMLLFLAMLAIFDTQVLSIWRRRREMGTLMALGMTRARVIELFTLEGAFHSVLAAVVAAAYGIPLLAYFANTGMGLPSATDNFGFALGERLFPAYSPPLIVGTIVLIFVVTTIVSFLPTRKIARLRPTDALRGKLT